MLFLVFLFFKCINGVSHNYPNLWLSKNLSEMMREIFKKTRILTGIQMIVFSSILTLVYSYGLVIRVATPGKPLARSPLYSGPHLRLLPGILSIRLKKKGQDRKNYIIKQKELQCYRFTIWFGEPGDRFESFWSQFLGKAVENHSLLTHGLSPGLFHQTARLKYETSHRTHTKNLRKNMKHEPLPACIHFTLCCHILFNLGQN